MSAQRQLEIWRAAVDADLSNWRVALTVAQDRMAHCLDIIKELEEALTLIDRMEKLDG